MDFNQNFSYKRLAEAGLFYYARKGGNNGINN